MFGRHRDPGFEIAVLLAFAEQRIPSVDHQVDQHLLQLIDKTTHLNLELDWRHTQLHALALHALAQQRQRPLNRLGRIERGSLDFRTTAKHPHVIDHPRRALDLGIDDVPLFVHGVMLSQFDLVAAATAVVLVVVLALLFNKTRIGVSLRAVADDTQAALSIGIHLNRIWQIVWAVAGVVGLVAGLLWGARQGVQFSLSLVVLKALPVLIIGGFTSIGGAIVGGLIVGAAENLAEVYIGPLIGGGITPWFAYVLALVFLYIRPAGLFGERAIERV